MIFRVEDSSRTIDVSGVRYRCDVYRDLRGEFRLGALSQIGFASFSFLDATPSSLFAHQKIEIARRRSGRTLEDEIFLVIESRLWNRVRLVCFELRRLRQGDATKSQAG